MGTPRQAKPVKLIVGLLGADADLLRRTRQLLTRMYGPLDAETELWPFSATDYYAADMGDQLLRQFVSFEKQVRPERLAEIKRDTNRLEEQIAEQAFSPAIIRPVNVDPGYIDEARLVLATTKDRAHRVYLGLGIYAEVTLHFVQGAWQEGVWTYPDYRAARYHAFFTQVREIYRAQRAQLEATLAASPDHVVQPTDGAAQTYSTSAAESSAAPHAGAAGSEDRDGPEPYSLRDG